MPDSPIAGHITKEAAAKHVKRSYRALGRDLIAALKTGDADVLEHWKLSTKDEAVRSGTDVTVEMVTQLRDDGFNPTWHGSVSWLEDRYGLRSEEIAQDESGEVAKSHKGRKPADESNANGQQDEGGGERAAALPDDVAFLKDMIRNLQREKREEMVRNEEREKKLFEQLAVKDKQISAWDEVTQGLTRGLATGMITPTLLPGSTGRDTTPESSVETASARKQPKAEPTTESKESYVVDGAVVGGKEEGTDVQKTPRKTKPKTKTTPKKNRPPRKKAKSQPKKPKKRNWLNTPVSELFPRRGK